MTTRATQYTDVSKCPYIDPANTQVMLPGSVVVIWAPTVVLGW